MHKIGKLVQENKNEAIELLKKNGGLMEWPSLEDLAEQEGVDTWEIEDPNPSILFYTRHDEYLELEITKARLTHNGKGIEFYSPDENDWFSSNECSALTENNVYEFLFTLCHNEE